MPLSPYHENTKLSTFKLLSFEHVNYTLCRILPTLVGKHRALWYMSKLKFQTTYWNAIQTSNYLLKGHPNFIHILPFRDQYTFHKWGKWMTTCILILHTYTISQMGGKEWQFFWDYLVQYVHEIRRLQKVRRRRVCGNKGGRRSLVALGAIQA